LKRKAGVASIVFPQRRRSGFSPLPQEPRHSSRAKKSLSPPSSAFAAAIRCVPIALAFVSAIAVAIMPARVNKEKQVMAIIGRITKDGDIYTGTIETLSFKAQIDLKPVEKRNDKAPNYRVYTSQSEVGAAWWMTSERGEEYLSVKLDDPAWPAPVHFAIFKAEDGSHNAIWSRPVKRD
jgi:uncharacterized protein (DUF736 family)